MTREEILEYAEAKKAKLQARMGSPESMYGDYAIYSPEFEFVSAAIAAIREQEERENRLESDAVKIDPLTLDELRTMDGEPVWIETKRYGVYADIVHIIGREDGEQYVSFKINYHLQENGCGKTWIAYRSKPKEGTE